MAQKPVESDFKIKIDTSRHEASSEAEEGYSEIEEANTYQQQDVDNSLNNAIKTQQNKQDVQETLVESVENKAMNNNEEQKNDSYLNADDKEG